MKNYCNRIVGTYVSIGKFTALPSVVFFVLCSFLLLMLTAGKCNKTNSAIVQDVSYAVTFNSNGGTNVNSVKVKSGDKVTKPTDPTRAGYTFIGWYSDQAFTQAFDFNTAITKDIILYAKWTTADIQTVLGTGKIPEDLTGYDVVSQLVLNNYPADTNVVGVYVKVGGTGDGSSWANAKGSVKDAIDGITDASSSKIYLVLVGAGEYKAGSSIAMKNNVAIIGGWPATGGWTRSTTNITELNGGNSNPVFENYQNGVTYTAVLYGVKIANGNANIYGGGMRNEYVSPTIINVTFADNYANSSGGGMYNKNASPILTNVTFSGNRAGTTGGGITNEDGSSSILTNITFSGNSAGRIGSTGSMQVYNSSPILVNAISWNNPGSGGYIYNSVIQNGSLTNGNDTTNPALTALQASGVFEFTGTSPVNRGLYVKQLGTQFYYSSDGSTWYTSPALTGATATPPSRAVSITGFDATEYPRSGRPDAGAWEHR